MGGKQVITLTLTWCLVYSATLPLTCTYVSPKPTTGSLNRSRDSTVSSMHSTGALRFVVEAISRLCWYVKESAIDGLNGLLGDAKEVL